MTGEIDVVCPKPEPGEALEGQVVTSRVWAVKRQGQSKAAGNLHGVLAGGCHAVADASGQLRIGRGLDTDGGDDAPAVVCASDLLRTDRKAVFTDVRTLRCPSGGKESWIATVAQVTEGQGPSESLLALWSHEDVAGFGRVAAPRPRILLRPYPDTVWVRCDVVAAGGITGVLGLDSAGNLLLCDAIVREGVAERIEQEFVAAVEAGAARVLFANGNAECDIGVSDSGDTIFVTTSQEEVAVVAISMSDDVQPAKLRARIVSRWVPTLPISADITALRVLVPPSGSDNCLCCVCFDGGRILQLYAVSITHSMLVQQIRLTGRDDGSTPPYHVSLHPSVVLVGGNDFLVALRVSESPGSDGVPQVDGLLEVECKPPHGDLLSLTVLDLTVTADSVRAVAACVQTGGIYAWHAAGRWRGLPKDGVVQGPRKRLRDLLAEKERLEAEHEALLVERVGADPSRDVYECMRVITRIRAECEFLQQRCFSLRMRVVNALRMCDHWERELHACVDIREDFARQQWLSLSDMDQRRTVLSMALDIRSMPKTVVKEVVDGQEKAMKEHIQTTDKELQDCVARLKPAFDSVFGDNGEKEIVTAATGSSAAVDDAALRAEIAQAFSGGVSRVWLATTLGIAKHILRGMQEVTCGVADELCETLSQSQSRPPTVDATTGPDYGTALRDLTASVPPELEGLCQQMLWTVQGRERWAGMLQSGEAPLALLPELVRGNGPDNMVWLLRTVAEPAKSAGSAAALQKLDLDVLVRALLYILSSAFDTEASCRAALDCAILLSQQVSSRLLKQPAEDVAVRVYEYLRAAAGKLERLAVPASCTPTAQDASKNVQAALKQSERWVHRGGAT
eukprot:TRINITY_DN12077_c0_g1_i1.p1 TRINITY_DN12077_c0_g1~~TRINITY_DN12077_c0_g1_i1.p1  ORF type:complete len:852 (+),score=266.93 TRINITY_DN12077_c0_g1_i1:108-2663(+)